MKMINKIFFFKLFKLIRNVTIKYIIQFLILEYK